MAGGRPVGLLVVAAAAGLLLGAGNGKADVGFWKRKCCPPPSYPVCHYWTPGLYRVWACFCAPRISQEALFRYPELPLTIENHPFPCPPVMPADTYSPYLLPVPGSTYQKKPKDDKAGGDAGPANSTPEIIPPPVPVTPKDVP